MPRGKKQNRVARKARRASHEDQRDKLRKRHVETTTKAHKAATAELDKAIAPLLKKYGAGSLMTIANQGRVKEVKSFDTGWPELNDLITGETDERGRTMAGTGVGWPRGRIIEVFGPEMSGKTTLTLHIIAAAQRAGLLCAFIDAEHALDTKYAANLGVDMTKLVLNQPDSAEQGLDITRDLARSGKFGVIVVDSVAGLEPEVEQKKRMSDSIVAAQARLMSRGLRNLIGVCAKSNTLLIFTNQTRMKIGVMFGNPETTPGGQALKFYASVRIDVRKVATLKNKEKKPIGHRARIKVVKNKVAPPFREVHADIYPNIGIKEVIGDPDFDVESAEEESSDDES